MDTAWGEPFQSEKTGRWCAWSMTGPRADCDTCERTVQEDEPRLRVTGHAGETLPGASHRVSDNSPYSRQFICEKCALEQEGEEVSKWAYRMDR
jgi:hypothetical protein